MLIYDISCAGAPKKETGLERTLKPSKSNWPSGTGRPRIKRTYMKNGLATLILLGEQPTLTRLESRSDATEQNVDFGQIGKKGYDKGEDVRSVQFIAVH